MTDISLQLGRQESKNQKKIRSEESGSLSVAELHLSNFTKTSSTSCDCMHRLYDHILFTFGK